MSEETGERLIHLMDAAQGSILHPRHHRRCPGTHGQFRPLVLAARERGINVIDRCNLTVLYEPGQEDLPRFLADNGVQVVARRSRATARPTQTRSEAAGCFSAPSRRSKISTLWDTAWRAPVCPSI